MYEILDIAWRFLFGSGIDDGVEKVSAKLRFYQRLVLVVIPILLIVAFLTRDQILAAAHEGSIATSIILEGDELALSPSVIDAATLDIKASQLHLASVARTWLSENRAGKDGFTWGTAQLVSAAPNESQAFKKDYLAYVRSTLDKTCNCYEYDGIPHTVTLAWVIISYAELGEKIPEPLIDTLLKAQSPSGWWSITLDATNEDANAATYATSLVSIALKYVTASSKTPKQLRSRTKAALNKSTGWLLSILANDWRLVADYPFNVRNHPHFVFWAMIAASVEPEDRANVVQALVPPLPDVPDPTGHFPSDAFVRSRAGNTYIDRYRHVPIAWHALGLARVFASASFSLKVGIRQAIEENLAKKINVPHLRRQEWMLAETVFARRMLLRSSKKARW